ncbi:hypothetical protein BBOV_I000175 [Babesia bovis T2Bo]|uniref:hypothetical protein n=1 Tax=Babesia bovis T2Bo TaxID=484906 RepID=UPI001C364394|nr:hypothetical protein BBOV_I000175 [Babesia bovis T2Bo]KAG6440199.1 hypothetical protein BBOV_I000175 [Babesia bovis T2Bo]
MRFIVVLASLVCQCLVNGLHVRHRINDVVENVTHKENTCDHKTQGIARLITEKEDPSSGIEVTLLLEHNKLNILKGNKDLKRFTLTHLKTPILIKTSECLTIDNGQEELFLCFPNNYSLNSWWMALSKQILCNNQGSVRNEIYGEATLEETQADINSLKSDEEKTGINIHIDERDPAKFPQIKVHYKE